MHKVLSKLTLTETFNLGCDIDLEHRFPTFSLDTSLLMMIYTQTEFGCKRLPGLELIKDIVETVIFWLYKPTQPSGNKYVSRTFHPSPLKTPQCFPFSSKIIHHTQRNKRMVDAAASQLMWTGTLGWVESHDNGTSRNNYCVCLHVTHHCKTPCQTPLRKWL